MAGDNIEKFEKTLRNISDSLDIPPSKYELAVDKNVQSKIYERHIVIVHCFRGERSNKLLGFPGRKVKILVSSHAEGMRDSNTEF